MNPELLKDIISAAHYWKSQYETPDRHRGEYSAGYAYGRASGFGTMIEVLKDEVSARLWCQTARDHASNREGRKL